MDLWLFALNILLTTTFTTIIIISFAAFAMNKNKVFLLLAIIFGLYLFDNTLSFTIELFSNLNHSYTSMYLSSPIMKIMQYSGISFCFLLLSRELTHTKIGFQETLLFIGLLVCMLCSPVVLPEPLASNVFYTSIQCYNIMIAWYIYRFAKKNLIAFFSCNNTFLARSMIAFIVLHFGIMLEDFYTINLIDMYEDIGANIVYRSLSENMMTLCFAILSIVFILRLFHHYSLFPTTQTNLPTGDHHLHHFVCKHDLTSREEEVLSLLIDHYTSQEIASLLCISDGTVKTHIHNIYLKCNVQKKRELLTLFEHFEA
ncbi:MAG: helix-turn-helix transcriptional regulator [Erysipelotrichaceae bacterium]